MALTDNPLTIALAAILAVTSGVVFHVVNIQILTTNIAPFAPYIFMITLGGAYLISERVVGDLDNMELGAFVVGLGSFLGITFVPQFASIVTSYQPYSGIALTVVVMAAFYILTLEDM